MAGLLSDHQRPLRIKAWDGIAEQPRFWAAELSQGSFGLGEFLLSGRAFHRTENPAHADERNAELRENIQPCNGT